MKIIYQIVLIIFLFLLFTGCLPSYHHGYMGTEQAPLLNNKKTGLINYTGISVSTGGHSNEDEATATFKLRHQVNYTHKWCSFSVHADAYTGFHSVEAVEEYAGESYNYYGIAPQISTSIFYPFKTARLGAYGSFGTFWEIGPYVDWIEKAEKENLITLKYDEFYERVCYGGLGILYEKKLPEDKMTSFQVGIGIPGILHGFVNIQDRKNIYSFGLSAPLDASGSIFLSYMRAW